MASCQGANVLPAVSPALSHASDSFKFAVRCSDEPFEAFDEPSSDDQDKVVWTGNELDSEDEFILVPHVFPGMNTASRLSLTEPRTPTLITAPTKASPKPKHPRRRGRSTGSAPTAPTSTPSTTPAGAGRSRRRRGKRDAAVSYPSPSPSPTYDGFFEGGDGGFGERLLIEESDGDEPVVRHYEDAVRYITSFLASPTTAVGCTRLTFLQSLIIELGLLTPTSTLPSSQRAAKRFIKTRAFVNISTYLSVRGQGVERVRSAMYNSRRELASDLRRRRGAPKANKGWVKQHGLSVLLVSVF